uniref:Retrotransposon gag domain-containing protein n=1 Tax=Lygus hesperus TaxID=30085 RepID=A0A0A9XBP2_LYGHE
MPKQRRGKKKPSDEELSDSQQDGREETFCESNANSAARVQNFKFPQYEEEVELWAYYINRFEVGISRLELTGSIDARTRSILLLTSVGPNPFKILVDHFRPRDIKEVPYKELKEVLGRFYEKSTCIFAERRAFAMRNRGEGESVAKFVNGLRTLAGTCEFGTSLEERLRDQLVIGINSSKWQEELIRLHQTNEATFQEVEASALTMEKAQVQQVLLSEFYNYCRKCQGSVKNVNLNMDFT